MSVRLVPRLTSLAVGVVDHGRQVIPGWGIAVGLPVDSRVDSTIRSVFGMGRGPCLTQTIFRPLMVPAG